MGDVGVLLGLLSALSFGTSDFVAGVGGRRSDPNAITVLAQSWSLFIGLDQAGTAAGSWPLATGQAVGALLLAAASVRTRPRRASWSRAWWPGTASGILSGAANLLFVASTGAGQLAVVAVTTSLYPAITIVLARTVLHERWSRTQAAGLVIAAAGVTAITLG